MKKVVSINKYKEIQLAKLIKKELEEILVILDSTYTSLNNYKKYKTVKFVLSTIKDNKAVIALHHRKFKKLTNGN